MQGFNSVTVLNLYWGHFESIVPDLMQGVLILSLAIHYCGFMIETLLTQVMNDCWKILGCYDQVNFRLNFNDMWNLLLLQAASKYTSRENKHCRWGFDQFDYFRSF